MMEASESIYVPNPNNNIDAGSGVQSSLSPNPDLDHDPNCTAQEEFTLVTHGKLQQLNLKDISEAFPKEEAEKYGNWDFKEAQEGQEDEREKGDSNWEEKKGGESEWNVWDNHGSEHEIVIDNLLVAEGDEVEEDRGDRNGSTVTKRIQYQYPVRPEAEDCAFYLKTGMCKFGSNCKFNHPVRRKNQVNLHSCTYMCVGGCGVIVGIFWIVVGWVFVRALLVSMENSF